MIISNNEAFKLENEKCNCKAYKKIKISVTNKVCETVTCNIKINSSQHVLCNSGHFY